MREDIYRRGSQLVLALICGMALFLNAVPARAVVVTPSSEFQVIESAGPGDTGDYTVINNSSDEYIYAFSVTNPLANSVKDWTTDTGWIAGKSPLFGNPKDAFSYGTLPGTWEFSKREWSFLINPETIGPGEQSSDFFFGTDNLASTATLFLVNAQGDFSTSTLTAAVPEASTWAMMILGFAAILGMAWRRKPALSTI